MKDGAPRYKEYPLEIAGSTKFGRYAKISDEKTYNMILSDGWLVPFAGYRNVASINPPGQGRGIYASNTLNKMFAVIDDQVYKFNLSLGYVIVGTLVTSVGDVFIAENNAGQLAFSDGFNIYIYDNNTNVFTTLTAAALGFTPGYLTFQNGRFISPDTATNSWRLSEPNNGLLWPNDSQHVGKLQTKPDRTTACIRFPGSGNLLLVFGENVTEQWYDVGAQLFPYQRSQSTNIDYGCINSATIAHLENNVAWLGINEQAGPIILYTNGGEIKHISTDGIDFQLANITTPSDSYGFMFRQDGHLFYCITFPTDNFSYAYDFNVDKFYNISDENLNYFVAKKVAFFNDNYYFVSINDGNLYQISSNFPSYDYGNGVNQEIPRIRIPATFRLPDQSRFVCGYAGFPIEQGQFTYPDVDTTFLLTTQDGKDIATQDHNFILGGGYNFINNVPRVDLSLSKDGGYNFGNVVSLKMRPLGVRQNRLMWWRLGSCNELTTQFRFYGYGRYVAASGVFGVYQ